MVEYIKGISRDQLFLFNDCLDEIIDENNIVRFIDAYVDALDMKELGFIIPELNTGKPPYSPQLKLKIYIYGYFEKIRSSRRLEKECIRNKELIWLTNALIPDFKTIADFRKDNYKAFKNVFKDFLKLCHRLELISFKVVAIDGTKMRGQNSLNEVYKKENIEKVANEIQEQINNYLNELDEMDKKEQAGNFSINQEKIQEITRRLEKQMKRKDKVEFIKNIFENNPEVKTYFATDNDCRFQSDKGKVRPGYNPQTAVDDKNKLIIVADVTNEQNDKKQYTPMVKQVKEIKKDLEIKEKTEGIADSGYYSEKAIINNIDQDDFKVVITPDAENKNTNNENKVSTEKYQQDDFNYNEEKDVYICPAGKELKKVPANSFLDKNGREVFAYKCKPITCESCSSKVNCTKGKSGRKIIVSANNEKILKYIEDLKTKRNRQLIKKRKELVEHPFGTIKRIFGYTYFLLKGIEKVKAEFSFISFIYNLKRVLNIVSMDKLIAVIGK